MSPPRACSPTSSPAPGWNAPWEDLAAPDETDAAQRLLAAGLIEEHGSPLQPTARCYATFDYSNRWEPPRLSALYGH